MDIVNGKHILVEHLMFIQNYGNFNSSIDLFWIQSIVWKDGKSVKLLVRLDNYIIIISECILTNLWFLKHNFLFFLFGIFSFYSLRTSETNYLNEAYQFYSAIRGRAYYSRAIKEDRYFIYFLFKNVVFGNILIK